MYGFVSEETLRRKREEEIALRGKARILRAEAVTKREQAVHLQREEERLGDEANDLDREIVDMEWQEPMLEQRIAEVESSHETYVRENNDTEASINMYRDASRWRREQEAGLRQEAENKKREAERLRGEAGQSCLSGIELRSHGNMAQANPILRQVEQLLNEAEELDRQANEHLSQIEKNNDEVQILMAHAMANARFRGELRQAMAESQTKLAELRRQLQEKRRESEENKARVNELRDEEDRYGYDAGEREEEADIADRQVDNNRSHQAKYFLEK